MAHRFLYIFLLVSSGVFAQDYTTIPHLKGSIVLDGHVAEKAWQSAREFHFHEYRPNWGREDSTTIVFVTFDEDHLYVGGRFQFQNKSDIVSRNLVRDGWQGDDFFTFQIDSYDDSQNAMVFSIYPEGSKFDLSTSNDAVPLGNSTFNKTYDMLWEGKSQVSEDGLWEIEYRIPLSNLRFKERKGRTTSKISFIRTDYSQNANYIFPLVSQEIDESLMKPSLKFPVEFKGLVPKKQLLIAPYILGANEKNSGPNPSEDNQLDAGLDVRYGISPKLTVDMTYNTDFSQVEADDQQINLNRTSLFFPERRRFFQEQAGLYEFNLGGTSQFFYSRRIGIADGMLIPIAGGFRLNGKVGNFDVGLLNLQTDRIADQVSENFGVLRMRRKVFNDRSFVGVMGTSRISNRSENFNYGLDGLIEVNPNRYFQFAMATGGEDGKTSMDKTRAYFALSPRGRQGFLWTLNYAYSGSKFDPGIGFVDRESFHNPFFMLQKGNINQEESGKKFRYTRWTFLALDQFYNAESGGLETLYSFSGWEATNFRGASFDISHITQRQVLTDTLSFSEQAEVGPGGYTFNNLAFTFTPATQDRLQHSIRLGAGKFYDGNLVGLTYTPSYNFNRHLNVSFRYQINRIEFKKRQQEDWLHIVKLRAELALNLHLSGSYTLQYNSDSNSLFSNVRLRYNFKDGHDAFFVFNANDYRSPELIEDFISREQTVILKYSYTFAR